MADTKRKSKTLRRYSYTPEPTIAVELEPVEHWNQARGDRKFKVYYAGVLLGTIESGEGQRSRHLFGNVAHFYKTRTFWYAEEYTEPGASHYGNTYSIKFDSQAEAIRSLIGNYERSPK